MKKTLIIIVLSLVLIIQPFNIQTASANSFVDSPGYAEEIFAGLMIGAMTVGAAAIHSTEYIGENLAVVRDSAINTWNTYAPEVQQAFINGIDWTTNSVSNASKYIDEFLVNHHRTITLKDYPTEPSSTSYETYAEFEYTPVTFVRPVSMGSTTFTLEHWEITIADSTKPTKYQVIIRSEGTQYQNIHVEGSRPSIPSNAKLSDVIPILVTAGFGVIINGYDWSKHIADPTFNAINTAIHDRPIGELDNIYLPRPEAYTPDNVKLRTDATTGTLSLPDGTIYTGDYTWRIPTTNVIEVDGIAIPTTTTAEGDVVNIVTGEVVIPATTNPPITSEGTFAPPTTALDFSPLMLNAQELTTKFPFSIPWDFIRQLNAFAVDPVAPKFDINIPNYFTVEDHRQSMVWTLDFTQFDLIGQLFRWFILIIFDIGLILGIRRLLPE